MVGDLVVSRTFNSGRAADASRYGSFGPGWNASFEQRLVVISPKTLAARRQEGNPQYYFDGDQDGTYVSELPHSTETTIETISSGHKRVFRAGGEEVYDSSGRIVSATDAAGITTTYTRDGQGRLTSISRHGRSIGIAYSGASARPYQLVGPAQAVLATYGYDASNRLETVAYPDGSGYHYFYDGASRILRVEDGAGKPLEEHVYDGQGRAVLSQTAEGVDALTLSYAANETVVTDSLGRATTYTLANIRGIRRVTKVTGPCSSCGTGSGDTQEWTYDAFGRITSIKNADGKITTYTYDSDGNRLTETDPLNHTTTYTYDAQGRVLTVTAPDTGVTTMTHGAAGPLSVADPLSRSTTITYNTQGKPATITDPRGKTTTLTYDATTADLLSVVDPLTHATTFGYDALGRRTTVSDALSHTTTTSYDARGRVTRVTLPDSSYTEFTYDASGNRTGVIDPLGRTTRYVYDKFGRLETIADAANGLTKYGYDLMSNLISLTDARAQATRFDYDGHNRVTDVRYPSGGSDHFTYDSVGRLNTKTDRKGIVTTYSYDDASRLVGKSYSDGVTPAVSFTYDAVGRMLTAANGTDTLTWVYNVAGETVSEQSSRNASTVAYTYDGGGNRLSISLDGSVFVTYAYDDASRLTTITRGSNAFSFGYDNANRRTSLGYPNGVTTTYSYDNLSRLTSLGASLGATTITSFGYAYDATGNRTSKTTPDLTESYGYDELYRLTEVGRTGSQTDDTFYRYDAVGNRLSKQVGQAVASSLYDAGNRLVSTSGGGPLRIRGHLNEPGTATVNGQAARMLAGNVFDATISSAPGSNTITVAATDLSGNVKTNSWTVNVPTSGSTYAYDSNGNLTQKIEGTDTWTYEWNPENELKRVLKNGLEQARFAYDALGRRVERAVSGATTTWTYDDEDLVRESIAGASTRFITGPLLDEPLAADDGASLNAYYHSDALGSVVASTDGTGAIVRTTRFDVFGYPDTNPDAGYSFTGREWDPEVGLYYYRARYYDPRLGRFISEDPGGLEDGLNLYTYTGNSPAVYRDPSGLARDKAFCDRLLERIQNVERRIQKRIGQLDENPKELPESAPGDSLKPRRSRRGHRRLINEDKALLAALRALYAAKCSEDECGGGGCQPDMVPVPVFVPSQQSKVLENTAKAAGAAAAGYVVYRCVRMIPSLFPPLWPTIPANAAVP